MAHLTPLLEIDWDVNFIKVNATNIRVNFKVSVQNYVALEFTG